MQTTSDSHSLIEVLQSSNGGPCNGTTLCNITVVPYNSSSVAGPPPLSPPPSLPPPLSPPPLGAGRRLQTADCGNEIVTTVIITREYPYSNGSKFETVAQPVATTSMQAVRNVSDCLNQTMILDADTKARSARVTA